MMEGLRILDESRRDTTLEARVEIRVGIKKMSSSATDALTAAVLTVSDSASHGVRADASGPALTSLLQQNHFQIIETAVVPDEQSEIQAALISLVRKARLVVSTGGTG